MRVSLCLKLAMVVAGTGPRRPHESFWDAGLQARGLAQAIEHAV